MLINVHCPLKCKYAFFFVLSNDHNYGYIEMVEWLEIVEKIDTNPNRVDAFQAHTFQISKTMFFK